MTPQDVSVASSTSALLPGSTPPARALSRLGLACMAYLMLATLLATLAPFRFVWPARFAFNYDLVQSDVVLNLLMMFPLGFLFRLSARSSDRYGLDALAFGALCSTTIELLQMFLPARCASLFDIAANAAGAWAGALLHRQLGAWFDRRVVLQLRTQPPLSTLLYLLLPALWIDGLCVSTPLRALMALPLGLLGAWLAVCSFRGGPLSGSSPRPEGAARITALVAGWFLLGSVPALFVAPLYVALSLSCVMAATWRMAASSGPVGSLRRCVPLLLPYLVGAALWPMHLTGTFRFTAGFPPFEGGSCEILLRLLEYVGAFTLLGYLLAELGRGPGKRPLSLWKIALLSGSIALPLEIARGFGAASRGSLLTLGLLVAAALAGAGLHQVMRGLGRSMRGLPQEAPLLAWWSARA